MPRRQKEEAPDDVDFRNRLKELVGGNRRRVSGLAQASGVNSNTIRSYLQQGGPDPSRTKLVALAQATGVSLDWLLAGRGPKSHSISVLSPKVVPVQISTDLPSDEYIHPPFYPDVRASAGSGASINDESLNRPFAIRADWFRRELARAPVSLALLNVDGDSMEPTLRRGDTILLDCDDVAPREGIFVLRHDEYLHVKRLQYRGASFVKIISDNDRLYPPYDVDLRIQDTPLQIIGRVIGVAHKI